MKGFGIKKLKYFVQKIKALVYSYKFEVDADGNLYVITPDD